MIGCRTITACVSMLLAVQVARANEAAPADANQQVAARLLSTTVTVRSQRVGDAKEPAPAAQAPAAQVAAADGVTVCSGVSVGKGLVVTFSHPAAKQDPAGIRYRVTLPDGQQAKAAAAVIDHYSGLTLLEIEDRTQPLLDLQTELPAVGATILTAAAAGIERPVVSRGIVSGQDRSSGVADLPPLLQCDVLTTESSVGAAIADLNGRLVGVIVTLAQPGQRGGWTYAVPARHVRRLIDARGSKLVVLERRRPSVGLTMGPGAKEGVVEVERIVTGGPAEQAGIQVGDQVVEAQGRKIRSAYQAVDLILSRQPGETMDFVVERGGQRRTVSVTLGGAAPQSGAAQAGENSQQLLNVRMIGRNQIEVRNGSNVAEVGIEGARRDPAPRSPGDEVGMLRAQLLAFEKVILGLQEEVARREKRQAEQQATIDRLQKQVEKLEGK